MKSVIKDSATINGLRGAVLNFSGISFERGMKVVLGGLKCSSLQPLLQVRMI